MVLSTKQKRDTIQRFLRFLKEEGAFEVFLKKMKYAHISPMNYLLSTSTTCFVLSLSMPRFGEVSTSEERWFWYFLDKKWYCDVLKQKPYYKYEDK